MEHSLMNQFVVLNPNNTYVLLSMMHIVFKMSVIF